MRVAANDVERILVAAANEVTEQKGDKKHSADYGRLVEAFKRAAALRDRPLRIIALRGRKDRVVREVIVTNIERGEAGHLYNLCLVPYTAEQMVRRKTIKFSTDIVSEDDKVVGQRFHDSGAYPSYHEQWIRTDRLREDGFRAA